MFADLNAEDPIYIICCIVIVMIFVQMEPVSFTYYFDLVCEEGNQPWEFRVGLLVRHIWDFRHTRRRTSGGKGRESNWTSMHKAQNIKLNTK